MQKHIKTLARRAKHLWGKLDGMPDYSGRLYDQSEYEALEWALETVGAPLTLAAPCMRADDDVAFDDQEPPRVADERPPRRPADENAWTPGATKRREVPHEPRGRRYFPNGSL
jgi:hypothetical protein